MSKYLVQVMTVCILVFYASAVKADSFFDVFFDVSYDKASQVPQLIATGRVITFGSGARTIDTEILSMSLSSYRGMTEESMNYVATVAVRSMVINSDGDTRKVDSFFDVFYECSVISDGSMKCMVTNAKAKSKRDHRGHVTVLK